MPVPVDDAIAGVYREQFIYLVSGWHDSDNVAEYRRYRRPPLDSRATIGNGYLKWLIRPLLQNRRRL